MADTTYSKRAVSRRGVASLAVFFAICFAVAWYFVGVNETPPGPPLTEEERRQMDAVLFNELYARHTGNSSQRQKRYEKLKAMVDRGFEPARFAISLYDIEPGFEWGTVVFDWFTYWRLKLAATKGDPSMSCLVSTVITDFNIKSDWEDRYAYVQRAAAAGQARCKYLLSGYYIHRSKHVKKDLAKARELEYEAARRGDVIAQVSLTSAYTDGLDGRELDFGKALCWAHRAVESGIDYAKGARTSVNLAILTAPSRGLRTDFPTYDPTSDCEAIVSQ